MIVTGFSLFLGVLIGMGLLYQSPEEKYLVVHEVTMKKTVLHPEYNENQDLTEAGVRRSIVEIKKSIIESNSILLGTS